MNSTAGRSFDQHVRRSFSLLRSECIMRYNQRHRPPVVRRRQVPGVPLAPDTSGAVLRRPAATADERFVGREDTSGATSSFADDQQDQIILHYATGWSSATIVYSLSGREWQRRPLETVASSGNALSSVSFRVPRPHSRNNGAPPSLEFVLTNGQKWDKRGDGGNYIIRGAGAYLLRDGKVSRQEGNRVLLVSDLDDTMIGDDRGTKAFRRYWQREALPRGSRLVYNTGRALDKCEELFTEKADVLPVPDFLITGVGTKLYRNEGGKWVVDEDHEASLERDWDLEVVRDAAYSALAKVGREYMHFRPPDEQNDHKVTCGVRETVVRKVVAYMRATLDRYGVAANIIVSGAGAWRYLDIVSKQAGKLAAIEFVRSHLGFSHAATVACGDSGNDIAMMEGRHRGIVVGNAQREMLEWLIEKRQHSNFDRKRLLLTDGERAHGILEGLAHFGFLT